MREINNFLIKSNEILDKVDKKIILKSLQILKKCQKRNGRIFFAGSGGGAGHGWLPAATSSAVGEAER